MRYLLIVFLAIGFMGFEHAPAEHGTSDQSDDVQQSELWTEYSGTIQIRNTADNDLLLYLVDKTKNGIGHFVYIQAHQPVIEDQTKSHAILTVHADEGYYNMEVQGNHLRFEADGNIYGLSDFTAPVDEHADSFTEDGALAERPTVHQAVTCQCVDQGRADDDCLSGGTGSVSCTHDLGTLGVKAYCRVIDCGGERYSCCTPE